MKKNKIIAISLILALVVTIILNFVYSKLNNNEKIYMYISKCDLLKGEKLSLDNLEKVVCFNENLQIQSNLINNIQDIENNLVLCENVHEGQIITSKIVCTEDNLNIEGYEYISLPISNATDAASYLLKKGDKINIYFTGKFKQISNVILNDLSIIYSTNNDDTYVTQKIYEDILLYDTCDESLSSDSKIFNNIIIRVKKEDVARLIILKNLGDFTVTKSNY